MAGMIEKDGRTLTTMEDWLIYAGPKNEIQWKDDRSAKESARAWVTAAPSIPSEIESILCSHADIDAFQEWRAEPEAQVRFDSFRGEPSNIDVLLVGLDHSGSLVVAVEAKADEPFGSTVRETLAKARSRFESNPRSKGVARVEQLLKGLFGVKPTELDSLLDLRYQLLTVSAAALAEAERRSARRAVVLIHEFITSATSDQKHDSNMRDLVQFVWRLSGRRDSLRPGALIGPFSVPGTPIVRSDISLYFGKAIVKRRGKGS